MCLDFYFSGIEYPGCVMNMNQLRTMTNNGEPDESDHSENEDDIDKGERNQSGAYPFIIPSILSHHFF